MKLFRTIGRTGRLAAGGALLVALTAACSIVNTTATEVALQYGGGPFDSVAFKGCTGASTHSSRDVNDDEYYFPLGQRDFTFATTPGADSPPLTSVTQDGQQITVTGTVKFTLDTSCGNWPQNAPDNKTGRAWPGGKLQAFYELICKQHDCVSDDPTAAEPPGWDIVLRDYLGAAIDFASDQEALNFPWQQLYSSQAATTKWSTDVQDEIPNVVNKLTFGIPVFRVNTVLLQKPGIQTALQEGLASKQAAVLRQQAAAVDEGAAKNFPGGIAGYEQYQQQQAINAAIVGGKVKVLPVPQGTSVIVGGS